MTPTRDMAIPRSVPTPAPRRAANWIFRLGRRVVYRLPGWALRCRPIVMYEIPLPADAGPRATHADDAPGGVELRWLETADDARGLQPFDTPSNRAQLDSGARRAAVALVAGRVIASAWVARDWFDDTDLVLRIELAPDEAWLYGADVDPPFRNQGVYGRMLELILARLAGGPARRLLLGVVWGNEPSRRAHVRRGARRIGWLAGVRSLGCTLTLNGGDVRRSSALPCGGRTPVRFRFTQPRVDREPI